MTKLQFLSERLARAKADQIKRADEIATRLDEYEAKAPAVFEAAHGAVDAMQSDVQSLHDGLTLLSNAAGAAGNGSQKSDDD